MADSRGDDRGLTSGDPLRQGPDPSKRLWADPARPAEIGAARPAGGESGSPEETDAAARPAGSESGSPEETDAAARPAGGESGSPEETDAAARPAGGESGSPAETGGSVPGWRQPAPVAGGAGTGDA